MMRGVLILPVLALTSGCVAVAIPVLAGGVLARKELGDPAPVAAPTSAPAPPPIVTLPAEPEPEPEPEPTPVLPVPVPVPETAPASQAAAAAELPAVVETAPPPLVEPAASELATVEPAASEPVAGGFAAFAAYAVAQTRVRLTPGVPRQSVLIEPDSLIGGPKTRACGNQPLAVALDLDPGQQPFDLANPPAAAPGLSGALAEIRRAGITVFWSTSLPVAKADKVYATLRAVGLDLDGTDRLLPVRKASEGKQQRRLAAAKDWCFIALAGDRPGDFEEALDYLRDPAGPTARAMDPLRGRGWFVIPQPID